MDIRKKFQTDEELEQRGVLVSIGDGTKLLVARLHNPRYNAALREALMPHKLNMDAPIPPAVMADVMARTILLGWEGVTENGEEVQYSIEKAKEYLLMKDFRARVMEIAGNMETYRAAAYEEAEKN